MEKFMALPTLLFRLSKVRPAARSRNHFWRFAVFVSVIGVIVFVSIGTASAHIDSLLPNQWTAGGPAFTLRILGRDFDESDTGRVLFNGTPVSARVITDRELQATIPASLVARSDIVSVTLVGFNSVNFTINPPPTITTDFRLPDAIPGQPYSKQLQVSGGTAPFTWSGTLPTGFGLSLSPDGLISGTAIPVETAIEFQATVTDAATVRAAKNFGLRIRYPCAGSCLVIEDVEVVEGDTGTVDAVFKVRLSPSSSVPVTVDYSTQDFTAAAPNDYRARNDKLFFSSGDTLKTIAVPVQGDTLYEAPEVFYVNLTNPVNASIGRGQGVCTISDNDPASITICSNDVPKREDATGIGHSIIAVDRDGIIDDVNVGLFLEVDDSSALLDVYMRAPGTEARQLIQSLRVSGRRLGTTCSPSPNCVFDDEAATRIDDASSPFVGSFKPIFKSNSFGARRSPRGTWTLDFSLEGVPSAVVSPTLNCWCLEFRLPQEGCRLAPVRATQPIFLPHTVRAVLSLSGSAVSGQVVSFTVRGEQDELRLQQEITSDQLGVAELSYYDLKPGLNFIEARAMVNGVLSIAKAQVTWVAIGLSGFNKCPFDLSTANVPEGEATLSAARSFRDKILARTPRGRNYTELYYQFSTEAVQIMMFNPMLMLRSREIIERYKPVIQATNGEAVTLTQGDLDEIDGFLNAFTAKGSAELQEAVKGVCHDLRDPQMHTEFGITVTPGPKRELPAQGAVQIIRQSGMVLAPLGLFVLCLYTVRARRKSANTALTQLGNPLLRVLAFRETSTFRARVKSPCRDSFNDFPTSEYPTRQCGDVSSPTYETGIQGSSAIPHTAVWGCFKSDLRRQLSLRVAACPSPPTPLSANGARGEGVCATSRCRLRVNDPHTAVWGIRELSRSLFNRKNDFGLRTRRTTKLFTLSLKRAVCVAVAFLTISAQWPAADRRSSSSAASLPVFVRPSQAQNAEGYGKLPLAFEANQGQLDSQVKFVSRGNGYNLFLTPTEAVLMTRGRGDTETLGQPETRRHGDAGTGRHDDGRIGASPRLPLAASSLAPPPRHISASSSILRTKLIGANPDPPIGGLDELSGRTNYFTGSDPAKWRTSVPSYASVKYENVYNGVDLIYYGNQQQLEYDFIVAPGADPHQIGLGFEGADGIKIDAHGDLVLQVAGGEVRQRKPVVYQDVNGDERTITARYVIFGARPEESETQDPQLKTENSKLKTAVVGFEVGPYDKTRPLIIDPVLQYSTYLGGRGNDEGNAITVDSAGNAYVIGFTDSLDFPLANAAQPAFGGGLQDAFVSMLDPSGTQLLYSTYIGGNGQDNGSAIAVDAAGNAYVTGYTGSTNFPVMNAMQPANSGRFNAFVAKLNPTGGLLYSTHLGGSVGDFGSSIAVDSAGNVYMAGVATSPNFPMVNAVQTTPGGAADVYVAKLNPSANQLVFSTYLGGSGDDGATSLAVDSAGNVYLTGVTTSPNFRTANPLQAAHRGGLFDAFVAKLNPTGTQLVYSTYLGGGGEDRSFRIAVDAAGNAYVTGDTDSINFPTANALQRNNGGGVDAFVAKLNPAGATLTYSTYLGGSSIEGGTAIAVDSAGSAYVTGFTSSANFPTVAPLQQAFGGGSFDGFVAKVNAAGSALDYSTYLGGSGIDSGFGIAVDASGNAYVMGVTDSTDFPVANAFQRTNAGGTADLFIAKIGSGPSITSAMIDGKKLLVFGNGFDSGAKILMDGQAQKTNNDDQNPAGALIGKKAGKKINQGQTVTLQVRNSDGALSNELRFTRQ